jgi:hypothetical protein
MNVTEEEYQELLRRPGVKKSKDVQAPVPEKKKSKYRNKMVKIDGIYFDSNKEGDYYLELMLRLKAGDIKGFAYHPQFPLPGGRVWEADFIVWYLDDSSDIIDIKGDWEGGETQVFKIKRDLFKERYPELELKIIK